MALVPDQKFSTFVDGGTPTTGDVIVGLRGGLNTKFNWVLPAGVTEITGTENQVLVNGGFGIPETGNLILTTPQDIATTSSPEFTAVKTGAILDSNGIDVLQFQTAASAVNWFKVQNSATGGGPVLVATGADADVELFLLTQGTGQIVLDSQNVSPIIINSGTGLLHVTNLIFANTAATRNVTFQDADGTLAYLSDIPAGTPSALTKVDDTNVTLTLGGTPATALLEAVSLTLGWTGTLSGTRGGTGVNNGANTLTLAGNLATSGAFASTFTMTGATNVTFPTSGTLATTAGTVSSITGTASQVLANGTSGSAQTGAVTLTLPQNIATSSSPQFTAVKTGAILDSNGVDVLQFGTTASAVNWIRIANTGTGGAPLIQSVGSDADLGIIIQTQGTGGVAIDSTNTTPFLINSGTGYQHTTNFSFANTAASRTVTFPDASGTVAFTSSASGIVNSGLINQLAYYAAAGTTLSGLATAASGVLVTSAGSVPSISTTLPNGLAMGTPASLTLTNATGLPIAGITGLGTGVATALAANVTGSGSIVLANGPTFVTSTVTAPSITFSTTSGVIGTTTNNNAAAGSVGEVISSVVASTTVTLTTNTAANVTSISLTAGDWNVWGNVVFDGNSATTVVYHAGWISTTSATLPANNIYASKPYSGAGTAIYSALVDSFVVPVQRISIAGTTTVYLSVQSGFGVNADKAGGAIYARRVR